MAEPRFEDGSWIPGQADLWAAGWLEWLILSVIVYLIVASVTYCIVRLFPKAILSNKSIKNEPERVLLVIAHPDDECMFFGPTILSLLQQSQPQFYVMCLSKGNFDGLGRVRKQELWNSCTTMGIPASNILLISHDLLRDDPRADWSTDIVGKLIVSYVLSHHIDTLITFDGHGVSGHKNHKALYFSVRELVKHKKMPKHCTPYVLESVNIFRKYIPPLLEVPLSLMMSPVVFMTDWKQYRLLRAAMSQHVSQYVWFRVLYLLFSRYLTINTLHHIGYIVESPHQSKKKN